MVAVISSEEKFLIDTNIESVLFWYTPGEMSSFVGLHEPIREPRLSYGGKGSSVLRPYDEVEYLPEFRCRSSTRQRSQSTNDQAKDKTLDSSPLYPTLKRPELINCVHYFLFYLWPFLSYSPVVTLLVVYLLNQDFLCCRHEAAATSHGTMPSQVSAQLFRGVFSVQTQQ